MVAYPEFSSRQTPLCTTALKYSVAVSGPISAAVSVAVVLTIVVGEEKPLSADLSHLNTEPVLLPSERAAGVVPEQISWSDDTVPPTVVGLTVIV
jgi:hypothetical protein